MVWSFFVMRGHRAFLFPELVESFSISSYLKKKCVQCPYLRVTLCFQTEMMHLLENEDLARTPIIVLANKQDLKDAMQVR